MKRVLFILVLILSSLIFYGCARDSDFSVSVLLTEGEGYNIKSQNPVHISSGGNVDFEISLDEGYSVVQVIGDNASFQDGVMSVKNVKYPQTVELIAVRNPEKYTFFLERNVNGGKLTSSVEQGKVLEGTKITLTASPNEGVTFIGWSKDKSSGSEGIISSDPCYTFSLKGDTTIYANFKMPSKEERDAVDQSRNKKNDSDIRMIIYNANGGTVASTGKANYAQDCSVKIYPMPNSLATPNIFVRDGYVLIEYNTAADGSGESYGLGHPVKLAENNGLTYLYCIWAKCSESSLFEYSSVGSDIQITKYLGKEDSVVVPEKIGGSKVVRICSNAFVDKDFKTLILPDTIACVEQNAVVNCKNMTTLYMFDSMNEIYDTSFSGTASFKTLFLNAAIAPRFSNSANSFARKWERLVTNADKERIIIVSGSSTYFGLDSAMLENLLNNEYCVVNYGTHGASNVMFYLDAISKVVKEGDTIVYAPEQLDPVIGDTALTVLNFHGIESCYNMLRYVDISKYTQVFSTFTQYNSIRSKMRKLTYEDYATDMNKYAERGTIANKYNSDNFLLGANGTFYFKKGVIPQVFADRLNPIFDEMKKAGATPCLSFPPYNINAIEPTDLNEESYNEYMADLRNVIHIPLISDVRDYIFPAKYMLNTDYHLNDYGREIRTKQIAKDLAKFLAK